MEGRLSMIEEQVTDALSVMIRDIQVATMSRTEDMFWKCTDSFKDRYMQLKLDVQCNFGSKMAGMRSELLRHVGDVQEGLEGVRNSLNPFATAKAAKPCLASSLNAFATAKAAKPCVRNETFKQSV